MYCPKCAAPIEGGKFCRACGANVSLIPQALTGRLATGEPVVPGKTGKLPSLEVAASSFFTGIGFLVVSFAVLSFAPAGRIWWFWFLIPAFGSIGRAVGEYLRYRQQQRTSEGLAPAVDTGRLTPLRPVGDEAGLLSVSSIPVPGSVPGSVPESVPGSVPGSVIEETTRHLDPVGGVERASR